MSVEENIPLYFAKLELENVRCFGCTSDAQGATVGRALDLTTPFGTGAPAQWTLLLGDNGVGKTTLLQCLAWMRPELWQDTEPMESPLRQPDRVDPALTSEENAVLEGLVRVNQDKALLKATLLMGAELGGGGEPRAVRTGLEVTLEKGQLQQAKAVGNSRIRDIGAHQPANIVAYGANRQMGSQNLRRNELEDPIAARLTDITELYDAEQILLELDHVAAKDRYQGHANEKLNRFKAVISSVLPDGRRPEDIEIGFPKIAESLGKPIGVHVRTEDGFVPLRALSLGYQTTLAWTVDFAWRQFEKFPDSPDPLTEPAILLIDEIDLHLHPFWQRTIIGKLSPLFPRTQFIATSHSPLVVQSLDAQANVAVLRRDDNDEVEIVNDPQAVRGWRVDQILTSELFGLPSARSREVEHLIQQRDSLLDKLDRGPEDESRLTDIEKKLETLPVAEYQKDREAMEFIRKAAELLQKP